MTEVYKIGVEIALAGSIMQGLEAISSKLLGIHAKVGDIEGGFKRWGLAIGGAAAVFSGSAIFKGLEKTVDLAGELVKQKALLSNMGFSDKEVAAVANSAQLDTQKIVGTTIAENVKGIREMVDQTQSLQEAMKAYPEVARVAKVLESMKGIPVEQSLQTLAKAVELRGGGIDPETHQLDTARYIREVEAAGRAIIASGGLIDPRQLLNFMQTAGPMARMVTDPDKFYGSFMTAMLDMGGFRSGTALTALGRQLLGGKMSAPTAEEMQRMGLLKEGSWHKAGTGVFVDKGGLEGEDILKDVHRGLGEWMKQVLIPSFTKNGITAPADVQQELYRVFGTETGRRMAGLYLQNSAQIEREKTLYNQSLRTEGSYGNVAGGDLGANVKNLQDAVTNFLQALGAPIVQPAISALQSLSNGINTLAAAAMAHPNAAKMIVEGTAGVATALTVLGGFAVAAALASFMPGGLIAVGIAALVLGLGTIAAFNWAGLKGSMTSFYDGFDTIAAKAKVAIDSSINSISVSFIAAIMSIPGALASAIASMGASIKAAIAKVFGGGSESSEVPRHGPPRHPSGMGPQDPHYDHRQSSATPIHVRSVVMLDRRVIGEAMSSEMLRLTTFPRQAPYRDSYAAWGAPDDNFATG